MRAFGASGATRQGPVKLKFPNLGAVCEGTPRLACSHQLFHQMKTDCVEGEERTRKKNS